MYASLFFWLALLLPGYVLVRRVSNDDLRSGLLGTVGLSYLAVFGLLSPISILCYLLRAPVGVFSVTCAVAVLAGAIEVTRQGWWRDIGKLFTMSVGAELLILVVDMVMGARAGAISGGDGVLHLARIRFLLDHGFSNYDPFVAGRYFFPIYHTNLHHALYAACCQLTGIHHINVWHASLAWAKLLIAAGSYYLAWSVFDRRWVAWVAAMFTVGFWGPVTYVVYPNKLAPLWLVALMISFVVQACQSPCTWKSPLKLGVGSLVLGQTHSLYAAFAGIVLGPVLGVAGLLRIFRRQPDRWRLAACTAVLTVALPFLLVSKFTSRPAVPRSQATAEVPTLQHKAFRYFDNGWIMMKPRSGWGTLDWRCAFLGMGIGFALVGCRRKQVGVFLAVAGTAVLILYTPPICTAALSLFRKEWIITRMSFFLHLGFVVLLPASVAFLIEPKTRFWWARSIISVLALSLAMAFAKNKPEYAWPAYYTNARAPREERTRHLATGQNITAFCEKHLPSGTTLLVDEWPGMVLTMLYDCHIMAPRRGSKGVPDIAQRRSDLTAMLAEDTPWETRRALLRKYGIKYFHPATFPTVWTQGHVKAHWEQAGFHLLLLDTD